ncbi:hypothetical protein Ae706Ps2_6065c [Pseudonocardia sp. Ae706_Ps2]|nr:hypothetical protein Ae706Ps2_6055c [Pseudonocardia sp. Ae706_Ps2]OLM09598.1 hypothetical protein Ae706Ps2_6060c [Pseudonocardia sp. Ae706_Ps2]OLM09603.1 hypothetical protein Ae706Ps2_6065c [Pseudonocardia sp. Ae706_Ps2]
MLISERTGLLVVVVGKSIRTGARPGAGEDRRRRGSTEDLAWPVVTRQRSDRASRRGPSFFATPT